MKTIEFKVPDMHCDGCTSRISKMLNKQEGVTNTQADLDSKDVTVQLDDSSPVTEDQLKAVVKKLGYTPS